MISHTPQKQSIGVMSDECEGQFTRPLRKIMCNYDEIMQQIDVACCKARQLSCTILLNSKHVYINAIQARKEKVCNHNSSATQCATPPLY